jgi:hypothetical protein
LGSADSRAGSPDSRTPPRPLPAAVCACKFPVLPAVSFYAGGQRCTAELQARSPARQVWWSHLPHNVHRPLVIEVLIGSEVAEDEAVLTDHGSNFIRPAEHLRRLPREACAAEHCGYAMVHSILHSHCWA